ncbi:RING-H2 finger protein ATL29-like [Benincasa hispida]|uniref:RING-H2 finger protein ATL29-like n=1 Tax=Benincasa hispida TaxID=102211 RepID=UPI0018FFE86F|nr:RING-H2 finger protein ATL29-like [Benincasa hispida]
MSFFVKSQSSSSSSSCSSSSSSSFLLHVFFRPMSTDFSHPPFSTHDHTTPPLTIILTLILLAFLLVGFFSIYFCRCVMDSLLHSRNLRRSPSGNLLHPSSDSPAPPPGLDPLLINSFPTFPYSGIKEFRSDKFGLECAICLLEFDDDSFLRLLTNCYHVFHQECIDLWLESHKTCPVCRRNLDADSPRDSSDKPLDPNSNTDNPPRNAHHESIEDAISIDIDDDVDDDDDNADADDDHHPSGNLNKGKQSIRKTEEDQEESIKRFSRCHSTGHSIVKARREGEQDKHKLRLPEHIKIKIIRGHNWTGSCVTFEEFLRNPGNGGGFSELSESDDRINLPKPP